MSSSFTPRFAPCPTLWRRGCVGARHATSCSARIRNRRFPTRGVPGPRLLPVRPRPPGARRRRARGARAARDRRERRLDGGLHAVRARRLRPRRGAALARALLARGLRRGHLRPVRRRDQRRRELRPGPIRPRLGQGCRPRDGGRPARPRLQLRLQPELLVRRSVGLPARVRRQTGSGSRSGPASVSDPTDRSTVSVTNRRIAAVVLTASRSPHPPSPTRRPSGHFRPGRPRRSRPRRASSSRSRSRAVPATRSGASPARSTRTSWQQVSEADVGASVVLVCSASGIGKTTVAFGLTRGETAKAFESRRFVVTVR